MLAPFRVAGPYVDPQGASTSKTKKKVPEGKKILPFIAGRGASLEIFLNPTRRCCAFLPSRDAKGAGDVRMRAEM